MPLASLGDSPRPAGKSGPGSYQITAFALSPRACDILCTPFKNEVSVSPSPVGLLILSPAGLKSQMFWELIFPVQGPQAGEPDVGLRTLTAVGEPLQCNYPPVVGHPPGGKGPDYIASPPFLPVLLWFVPYVFSCRRSFLVGCGLFSSMVVLQIILILVCL